MATGDLAVSDWGGSISIGVLAPPPGMGVGQAFISFGEANGLSAGGSFQAIVGNTSQKQWDISGKGEGGGFGYGDVAGLYHG